MLHLDNDDDNPYFFLIWDKKVEAISKDKKQLLELGENSDPPFVVLSSEELGSLVESCKVAFGTSNG